MEVNWETADDDWEKLLDFGDDLDSFAPPSSGRRGPPSNTPTRRTAKAGSFSTDPNAANPRHVPEQLRAEEHQATEDGERSTSIYKANDETSPRTSLCHVSGGHEISYSLTEKQGLNEERTDCPEQRSQDAGVHCGDEEAPASSKQGFSRDVPDVRHNAEEIDEEPDVRLLSSVGIDRRLARDGHDGNSRETRGRTSKRIRKDGNAETEWDDPILVDERAKEGMDGNEGSVPGDGRSLPASPLLPSREAVEDRHGCHVSDVELPPSERDCSPERATSPPVTKLGYRIRGPAGALRNSLTSAGPRTHGLGLIERHFGPGRPSHGATVATDSLDFREGPWLAAMDFLNDGNHSSRSTIVTIKATKRHIPQFWRSIRDSQGLYLHFWARRGKGVDIHVQLLEDPTGTIGGTIHRKVMTDLEDGGLIAPGAVIILRKVAVFSPTPLAHYLNITVNNVDQIFGKDTIAPRRRGRAVDDSDTTGRDHPISEVGLGGMSQMRTAARTYESETIAPNCGISERNGVAESAKTLGNDEGIQPDCPNDKSPGSGDRVMKSPPMPTILEDAVDSRDLPATANVGDGNARASQDDIAKAAGWDFSEDVELLLADDDFL